VNELISELAPSWLPETEKPAEVSSQPAFVFLHSASRPVNRPV